jgi:hypothetical protein
MSLPSTGSFKKRHGTAGVLLLMHVEPHPLRRAFCDRPSLDWMISSGHSNAAYQVSNVGAAAGLDSQDAQTRCYLGRHFLRSSCDAVLDRPWWCSILCLLIYTEGTDSSCSFCSITLQRSTTLTATEYRGASEILPPVSIIRLPDSRLPA